MLKTAIHSRFLFVDVAARRANQLIRGARRRLETRDLPRKPARVAMEEVRQGLIEYHVPQ